MARRPRSGPPPPDPLTPRDHDLLALLAERGETMRAALCTFARLGVAWRKREPARARAWLGRLETNPFYKGGQFLFDLLEWEDFMLDGPPPPLIPWAELAAITAKLTDIMAFEAPTGAVPAAETALPPLEPGFYLYRDVLLGLIVVLKAESGERAT